MHTDLTQLAQAIRDRIAHIDFTLLFKGEAVRADVVERFDIAATQATKDFILYRELAPHNIEYDQKRRVHKRGQTFVPLFEYDVIRTLGTLSQGYGDGFSGKIKPVLACEAPYHLNQPSLAIVASITEAIHKKSSLRIGYVSLSSGVTERDIVPHTLVDNGLRWHVRAFDRVHGEFRDFVLTRITSAQLITDMLLNPIEDASQDQQWHQWVDLELVPHPKLLHPQAIELDYGMKAGVLNVKIRAATAGYLLRQWHVDCSLNANLPAQEYSLWLKNSEPLSGITHLNLAPGYISLI